MNSGYVPINTSWSMTCSIITHEGWHDPHSHKHTQRNIQRHTQTFKHRLIFSWCMRRPCAHPTTMPTYQLRPGTSHTTSYSYIPLKMFLSSNWVPIYCYIPLKCSNHPTECQSLDLFVCVGPKWHCELEGLQMLELQQIAAWKMLEDFRGSLGTISIVQISALR